MLARLAKIGIAVVDAAAIPDRAGTIDEHAPTG